MKKKVYFVTCAVYCNNGLGLDIKSMEDVQLETESLEEAQKEFDFRKSFLKECLTHSEASDKYFHKDVECVSLYSCFYDDEEDCYDDYDYLDDAYSIY